MDITALCGWVVIRFSIFCQDVIEHNWRLLPDFVLATLDGMFIFKIKAINQIQNKVVKAT